MQPERSEGVSRRTFVKSAAVAAAAAGTFPHFATGAENDKVIKVGVVGCGGRGTGAAHNAMDASKHVRITAIADLYQDRLDNAKKQLSGRGEIKHSFLGFDGFQKVCDTDVDYVILATPPYYRPEHMTACVKAGKHVFCEKPVAVDPVGIRRFMAAGEAAKKKGLSIVAGTQRRHQNGYVQTMQLIHKGAIGKIVSAQCYWNGGQLWYKTREPGWSEQEWMHRDWVNWTWLSGDHIVEQHVHNLDIINWAIGTHPTKVVAMGARHRRVTGNQFDCFSADYEYPDNVHVHSMCRQISGCVNNVSERVMGTEGVSNCNGWLSTFGQLRFEGENPYVQEHKDLIAAMQSEPLNEAQNVAESTLTAIMGRISAYTGKEVTWDEVMKSDLVPPSYELSEANIREDIATPGTA